jgi:hypothetical protein
MSCSLQQQMAMAMAMHMHCHKYIAAETSPRAERKGPRLAQHKQSSTGRVEEYAVIS